MMRVCCFVLLFLVLLAVACARTHHGKEIRAVTHQLSYDGLVSPSIVSYYHKKHNENHAVVNSKKRRTYHGNEILTRFLVQEVSDSVVRGILEFWRVRKMVFYTAPECHNNNGNSPILPVKPTKSAEMRLEAPTASPIEALSIDVCNYNESQRNISQELFWVAEDVYADKTKTYPKLRCHIEGTDNTVGATARTCTAYHEEETMVLRISNHFYVTNAMSVALQSEITLTTTGYENTSLGELNQDILIQTVSTIISAIQTNSPEQGNDPSSSQTSWSIRSRPSYFPSQRQAALRQKKLMSHESNITNDRDETPFKEMDSDNSLESTVLSKNNLHNRVQVSSKTVKKRVNSGDKTQKLQIWQYDLPTDAAAKSSTHHAIFLNSKLRSLTTSAGISHAEAFVHPALIAHPSPNRVAIISSGVPLAIIREVMKYKSTGMVRRVDVVGADRDFLIEARNHVPDLDDCSGFSFDGSGSARTSCLDDEVVHVVEESVDDWINNEDGDEFDVVLLDVSRETDEIASKWFSVSFHLGLTDNRVSTSDRNWVVVVNAGSAPSMDWTQSQHGRHDEAEYPERDLFLREATRERSFGGMDYFPILVYDEPMAAPLDTSFILCFNDEDSLTYERFVRKSTAAIDLDLAHRIQLQKSDKSVDRPTSVYDGATHSNYRHPSRAWETWYCNTSPFRDLPVCDILQKWFDISYHHSHTEVHRDAIKGRSLFAAEDIPKGHFVQPEDSVWSLNLDITEWRKLNEFVEEYPDALMYRDLRDMMLAYGFETETPGITGWTMSLASTQTFTNHACSEKDEAVGTPFEYFANEDGEEAAFIPVLSRRPDMTTFVVAYKDIKKGEEIMQDYRSFRSDISLHPDFDQFLTGMCDTGEGLVPVSKGKE